MKITLDINTFELNELLDAIIFFEGNLNDTRRILINEEEKGNKRKKCIKAIENRIEDLVSVHNKIAEAVEVSDN